MVSNFFPTVVMFGILGWVAMPLDIGSVMTASVALGIAIDDTFHYLTFFRRGLEARPVASRRRPCRASTLRPGDGAKLADLWAGDDGVLSSATFSRRAVLRGCCLALLMVGLAANLILLPALVVGPFGKLFEAQYPRSTPKAVATNPKVPKRRSDDRVAA